LKLEAAPLVSLVSLKATAEILIEWVMVIISLTEKLKMTDMLPHFARFLNTWMSCGSSLTLQAWAAYARNNTLKTGPKRSGYNFEGISSDI